MLSKQQVKANFNKSALAYDQHALTQRLSANFLVEFLRDNLPSWQPETILDIGVGTGFTSEELFKHFPDAKYLLNDLAPNMLNLALKKFQNHPKVTGLLGDAETSFFPQTDLVISNLTFQWFNELAKTLQRLWQETSVLAFATLVKGTFQEWYDYLHLPLHTYPTTSDLIKLCQSLKASRIAFQTCTYPLAFDTPLACAKYLKNLGGHATCLQANHHPELHTRLKDDAPMLTSYQIFYAILIKEQP